MSYHVSVVLDGAKAQEGASSYWRVETKNAEFESEDPFMYFAKIESRGVRRAEL